MKRREASGISSTFERVLKLEIWLRSDSDSHPLPREIGTSQRSDFVGGSNFKTRSSTPGQVLAYTTLSLQLIARLGTRNHPWSTNR